MKIDETKKDAKNWRPQLLLLHSMPWSKEMLDVRYLNLLNLASQMKAGKGLTMVVSFVRGDSSSQSDCERAQEVRLSFCFLYSFSLDQEQNEEGHEFCPSSWFPQEYSLQ